MAPPRIPIEQRFWPKVEKTDGCWIWRGFRQKAGYGVTTVDRRCWLTHRVAWTLCCGPIPDGLGVLHHCDNPPCVRPDHLFLGTNADNMADMNRKGRGVIPSLAGSDHPAAKMSETQVLEIRRRYAAREPGFTTYRAAEEFGIHQSTAWAIVTRRLWRNLA